MKRVLMCKYEPFIMSNLPQSVGIKWIFSKVSQYEIKQMYSDHNSILGGKMMRTDIQGTNPPQVQALLFHKMPFLENDVTEKLFIGFALL